MSIIEVGKVRPVAKGTWDADIQYDSYDWVKLSGSAYIADGDVTKGISPPTTPWILFGAKGDKGDQGVVGPQGIQGNTGVQGVVGETGETGTQGIQGETGIQGIQGETGPQGVAGVDGADGIQGIQGIQGEQGIQGVTGNTGAKGDEPEHSWLGTALRFQNPDGSWATYTDLKGATGATGAAGSDGAQGAKGDTGEKGNIGDTGEQGEQGEPQTKSTLAQAQAGTDDTTFMTPLKVAQAGGIPTGSVVAFPVTTTAPKGFLLCNGATFSSTTYNDLFTVLETTTLPDYRGVALRGLDEGRGLDSGRTINSYQADDNKAHTHTIQSYYEYTGTQGVRTYRPALTGNVTMSTNSSGTEARMKNVSVRYYIKY